MFVKLLPPGWAWLPQGSSRFQGFLESSFTSTTYLTHLPALTIWIICDPTPMTLEQSDEVGLTVSRFHCFNFLHDVQTRRRRGGEKDKDLYLTTYEAETTYHSTCGVRTSRQ